MVLFLVFLYHVRVTRSSCTIISVKCSFRQACSPDQSLAGLMSTRISHRQPLIVRVSRRSSIISHTSQNTNANQVFHIGSFVSTLGIDKFSMPSFTIFFSSKRCVRMSYMYLQHGWCECLVVAIHAYTITIRCTWRRDH